MTPQKAVNLPVLLLGVAADVEASSAVFNTGPKEENNTVEATAGLVVDTGATEASEPLQAGLATEGVHPQVGAPVVRRTKTQATINRPKKNNNSDNKHRDLTAAYVFDAQRRDLQEEFSTRIRAELIPAHNAECRDIAKEADEIAKGNQARAKTKKRARILWLVQKRWKVLNELSSAFRTQLETLAVEKFDGKVETVPEKEIKEGKEVAVARQKITFPDGSISMLKTLYIPFEEFEKA